MSTSPKSVLVHRHISMSMTGTSMSTPTIVANEATRERSKSVVFGVTKAFRNHPPPLWFAGHMTDSDGGLNGIGEILPLEP